MRWSLQCREGEEREAESSDRITVMTVDFPIVPIKLTLGREDQPKVPAFPTDAKEVAIVCLSAALLFTSLAVVALATER